MDAWYYVIGNDRKGPVDESKIKDLLAEGQINQESYVWRKGFEGWKKVKEVEDLKKLSSPPPMEPLPPLMDGNSESFNWNSYNKSEKIFTIKIGPDRGLPEQEYGPYTHDVVQKLVDDKRINGKTLIFAPGMEKWNFLADTPFIKMEEFPGTIEPEERRKYQRRPFTARLLFHDSSRVFEGICRDISVGGLQILVAGYPGKKGDMIQLNVHPSNQRASFTAKGKIVRLLEGGTGFSIRFESLGKDAEKSISDYLKSEEM